MGKYASQVVSLVQSWRGRNEADGSHKEIIDIYNNGAKPLPRGYKVKYTDAWCATTTSSVAIELWYTDIVPIECSCYYLIQKAKEMGIWVENENRLPSLGELCLYDWDDKTNYAKTDNTGSPEHIGIVTEVNAEGGYFIVTEGNYSNSVKDRKIAINGRYIRGFICPKYDAEPINLPTSTPKPNKKSNNVKRFQEAAIKDGFEFPKYGADGEWGNECRSVAKVAIVKERKSKGKSVWKYPNLTKLAQELLGFTGKDIDGKFGDKSGDKTEAFQNAKGLIPDRCIGLLTWEELLGV